MARKKRRPEHDPAGLFRNLAEVEAALNLPLLGEFAAQRWTGRLNGPLTEILPPTSLTERAHRFVATETPIVWVAGLGDENEELPLALGIAQRFAATGTEPVLLASIGYSVPGKPAGTPRSIEWGGFSSAWQHLVPEGSETYDAYPIDVPGVFLAGEGRKSHESALKPAALVIASSWKAGPASTIAEQVTAVVAVVPVEIVSRGALIMRLEELRESFLPLAGFVVCGTPGNGDATDSTARSGRRAQRARRLHAGKEINGQRHRLRWFIIAVVIVMAIAAASMLVRDDSLDRSNGNQNVQGNRSWFGQLTAGVVAGAAAVEGDNAATSGVVADQTFYGTGPGSESADPSRGAELQPGLPAGEDGLASLEPERTTRLVFDLSRQSDAGHPSVATYRPSPAISFSGPTPARLLAPTLALGDGAGGVQPIIDLVLGGGAPYAVHCASFKNAARAERVLRDLRTVGIEPRLAFVSIPEQGLWCRVVVGSFTTAGEARRLATQLVAAGETDFAQAIAADGYGRAVGRPERRRHETERLSNRAGEHGSISSPTSPPVSSRSLRSSSLSVAPSPE